nr:DUF5977 domain-containing protein [uncultured Flavobacterium sp.]
MKKISLLFFLFSFLILKAQEETINIVTPSIENYNFIKYGGLDMSNNNGGFAYSVPLYTAKLGDINVPVSLSYYTDGVRVNDIAGLIGMNWNLMAGGMITRVVKDEPDEDTQTIKYRPDSQFMLELIAGNYTDAEYLASKKTEVMNLWNTSYNTPGANYYNKLDTEQDFYSFNFNGHTGNFYIDNNQIYLDTDEIGIRATFEKIIIGAYSYLKFTFITPDGIKYTFGGTEETVESSEISGDCARTYRLPIPTTWYLKQIEHQNQFINFSYKTIFKYYPYDYSQSITHKIIIDNHMCADPSVIFDCTTNFKTSNAKVLTQIDFGISNIKFNYLTQREDYYSGHLLNDITVNNGLQDIEKINFSYIYSNTGNINVPNLNTLQNKKRAFLQSLTFKNNTVQNFEYNNINGLSPRLSYSQDIYGYNNGNTAPSLLNVNYDGKPQNGLATFMINKYPGLLDKADRSIDAVKSLYGVLNKIIYPTKGYSVIDYENNVNLENVDVKKWLTKNIQSNKTPCHPLNDDEFPSTHTFTFTSNGSEIWLNANASVDLCDGVTVSDIHDRHSLTVKDLTTGAILYSLTIDVDQVFRSDGTTWGFQNGDGIFPPLTSAAGHQYSITYSTLSKFNDVYGNLDIQYNSTYIKEPMLINYSGARVKSIADYDTNGQMYNEKKYFYNDITDLTSGKTSLYHNYLFSPWKWDCVVPECFTGAGVDTRVDCENVLTFASRNYLGALISRGNRINYEAITTLLSNKNAIENKFLVSMGELDAPQIVHRIPLKSTTRSNPESWFDGKLAQTNLYTFQNNIYIPAKSTQNKYDILDEKSFYNYNTELGIKKPSQFEIMDKDHVYNSVSLLNGTFGCTTIVCNLQGKLSIEKYFNYCITRAKTETTEIEYSNGNAVTNITKFNYASAKHKFLSSQSTTNSKAEVLETKYLYPQDSEMINQPFIADLIAQNKTGIPLNTKTLNGITKISEQLTVFDKSATTSNLLLPKNKYVAKFPNDLPSIQNVGNLEKKITYDKYDDKGNLLQYTPENGSPVSIIWGYNRTQPIAKIENASYDQVQSYVVNLQNLSDADDDNCMSSSCKEQNLRDALNALRTALSQFMVSTYTYNPLVGVTSITDAKGMPSYYEYDISNRLKFIKDKDLNVLQKYCYNYKGQLTNCNDNTSTSVVLYKSAARSASFTKNNCASGGAGSSVAYSQNAGAATSDISQADADSKGLTKFNTDGQANANATGICTFNSIARSGSFTKNNCASGGVGSSVAYSQNAGASTSTISQADADSKGLAKFNTDGQANANTTGICTFSSIARNGSFTKNNCASGGSGSSVSYSQSAGASTSTISQADADSKGLTKFNTDGQANANVTGICTFSSIARNGSFTKNSCASGGVGSSVAYSQAIGASTSTISQADVDSKGLTKFNTDGQANANTTGICTFSSIARSGSFTKNNCASGGVGSSVAYSQAIGASTSTISQADADSKGLTKFNTDGQANANTIGICTFSSIARSGSFTKNNCASGGVGSSVSYSQSAGVLTSTISQADADSKGLAKFNTDGQTNANTAGICTFSSSAQSGSFTKNNCAPGGAASIVTYSQGVGVSTSTISQADADSKGLAKFNTDGQTNANTAGICTFSSIARSGSFTKNNCGVGTIIGTTESYSQSVGASTSTISQEDADAKGLQKFNTDGQSYANSNGYCFYYNTAKSGSFTKNNCALDYQAAGPTTYTVAANTYISYTSQADADSGAQAIVNSNGQSYANANGVCNPIYFNATGNQEFALRKMFITLTATSSNHGGHSFHIEIVYDTATNSANYKTVDLALLAGETSKTFTVSVPALSNAEISF